MDIKTYLLNGAATVQLTPDSSITPDDIERVIMTMFGCHEETPPQSGVGAWSRAGKLAFISLRDRNIVKPTEFYDLATSLEAVPLDLFNDASMAQEVQRRLQIHIIALPFKQGSLAGLWRAERLTPYRPFDVSLNGFLVNEQQPLANESTSIIQAILVLACRIQGIGKTAFISFPSGAEGEAVAFYSDPELKHQFEGAIGTTIFPAPALDEYALIGAPKDVIDSAVDVARAECRAVLADNT